MIKRVKVMVVLALDEGETFLHEKFGSPGLKYICSALPIYCVTYNGLRFKIDLTIDVERSGYLMKRGISERYTCLVTVNGIKGKKYFYKEQDDWYCDV